MQNEKKQNITKSNSKQTKESKIGVILMTYGSATTSDNVREYFESIYKGKDSETLIADFENRYRLVGHSPLVEITMKQAALLEKKLNEKSEDRHSYIVRAGMRHSAPLIADAVAECKTAGATQLVGIVLSPQFSSFIMDGYRAAFLKAAEENSFKESKAIVAGPWPTESHFVGLLANRVRDSLVKLQKKYAGQSAIESSVHIPVIFTTHSLPESVVKKDPSYLDQLQSTIDAVLSKLGVEGLTLSREKGEWYSGYQSAGHTPEAWLKPDLTDILDQIASKEPRAPAVLIVPIQFLTDHLEILYDLDIAAKKQCDERDIAYNRIELPNTDQLFIDSLANITISLPMTLQR